MQEWWLRRLEGFIDNVVIVAAFGVVVAFAVGLWAVIQELPAVVVFVLVLVSLVVVVWGVNGIRYLLQHAERAGRTGGQLGGERGASAPGFAAITTLGREEFDPYRFMSSKIMRVDLTGLWAAEHDHYIDFIVYVRQTSDWDVTLTDVSGRIRIGSDECSLPARLVNAPRILSNPTSPCDCVVRQPLSDAMASALAINPGPLNLWETDARVRLLLSGLKWIGTVAMPSGPTALPDRVVCDEEVTILGPVREGDGDKVLVRGGVLLSSQVWRHGDSGLLREQVDEKDG